MTLQGHNGCYDTAAEHGRDGTDDEQNPDGHRQMLVTATEVQRTGRPRSGSVPWSELKTELGR